MTSPSNAGALDAVERILNRGGEAGDVLQQVVDVLHERTGSWVAIVTDSAIRASSGGETPANRKVHPIALRGKPVGRLWTSADVDPAHAARVALIVSPYCNR